MKFQLYKRKRLDLATFMILRLRHQLKHAWPKGRHLSAINVYTMRVVTDISKYVTVAARQIILKESSIKKQNGTSVNGI